MSLFAEVLLEYSIGKRLDYAIPPTLPAVVGSWVEVPVRASTAKGLITSIKTTSSYPNPKPILRVISDGAALPEELFKLALWMSEHYCTPIEKSVRVMLPKGVRESIEVKRQYLVVRRKSKDELAALIPTIRVKAPQQAHILEYMLQIKGGILLTELLEQANCSNTTAQALVEKGLLGLERIRSEQSLLENEEYFQTKPKPLTGEQQQALEVINTSIAAGIFKTHLLFGVTGSGKTEVYCHAIQKALDLGKGVIMLVPEIALTAQTIHRFKSRFAIPIAVLHHRLSDGERHAMWDLIRNGTARIAIGARSSIFSPMPNLGLIIVDEEHETSYKQTDDSPCYNARDVAIVRGKFQNATVLLGSATPSLESYYNASQGKYSLLSLSQRPSSATLPAVHIVDMKREFEKAKGLTPFSDLLLNKIEERVSVGEQVILFLNRRGFYTLCRCNSCFTTIKCQACDTPLTLHKRALYLACHLCGFQTPPPKECPSCKKESLLEYRGIGTEKVEAALHAIFPKISTVRVDADTTKHKGSLDRLLNEFRSGKADVLIGTQMIAKGLHFPEVTLVGVLNCDSQLNIPDYRAQEQVFQLITQVAGRAGRSFAKGEVIIQTTMPDNETILAAKDQDYPRFYTNEISHRRLFGFPPFSRISKFLFYGEEEVAVQQACEQFAQKTVELVPPECICHPPLPAGHPKIMNKYRYQFLIRTPQSKTISKCIAQLLQQLPPPKGVQRAVDIDANSTFF